MSRHLIQAFMKQA